MAYQAIPTKKKWWEIIKWIMRKTTKIKCPSQNTAFTKAEWNEMKRK